MTQKINTCLWFENQAEEAAKFYISVFKDSKMGRILRMGENQPAVSVEFMLRGEQFVALNGRPAKFGFNESSSLMVACDTQEEIDHYWNTLTANGGEESMCGWLKDKYGVSWQIYPPALVDMINDNDPVRANRVMQLMMTMRKIEIAPLKKAYEGR